VIAEGALIDDRYRLDRPIGHGRAGVVWLAFDTQLHRTVCAKPMYIPDGLDATAAEHVRADVLREGRSACRVVHGCAITVYDTVADSGNIWQLMEYVPSRTMDEFLHEHGNLAPEHTAYLGMQLAAALAAAHADNITHGAVEPGNVLLADDGGVKLTDFAVSTPGPDAAYRAPERADGAAATPAADAFSLGCTLYRAVEGIPPFGADGSNEQTPPHHAGVLTGVLLKLLHRDPQYRPPLSDAVAALQALAGDTSATEEPAEPTTIQQPVAPSAGPETTQLQPRAHRQAPTATGNVPHGPPPGPEKPTGAERSRQLLRRGGSVLRLPANEPRRGRAIVTLAIASAIIVGIVFTEIFVL